MKAGDLAVAFPTVTLGDPVADAVRLMGARQLPGLIVVDDRGRPRLVLPGTQVLRMVVLDTYQEDPALARAVDEAHADEFWRELGNRTVSDCLPRPQPKQGIVPRDAALREIAPLMARLRTPLVAVADRDGSLVGAITLGRLLAALALAEPSD